MEDASNFGSWLRRRRREMDLTQRQLAECAACSPVTIRKFESGERRPSRELAELLAGCLGVPGDQRAAFVDFVRGLQARFDPGSSRPSPALAATGQGTVLHPLRRHAAPLPVPPTPFIGRQTELLEMAARLADPACRLVTVAGPGGMGKTRLALAAAQAGASRFADGVAYVSLAAVGDLAGLSQNIAHALDISLTGGEEPAAQLGRYLQDKELLLVLDNFETVLEGADSLANWLQQAPDVKWLVTSRERLNLAEEWLLPLQGFDAIGEGMALFATVARRVQPDFSLARETTAVSQICSYVEGMPLAIELAAGWARTLSCQQILDQLQQTFDFLSTSLRNVPQRHRSLRHLFDQSWQLLPQAEQQALMKLSVFQGGFTQEAARPVADASLSLLRSFADRALVMSDGHGRYYLHELMRQYAVEKLRSSPEEEATCQRHMQTYLALAETFDLQRSGPAGAAWFERLEIEYDNLRAALAWLVATGRGEEGLRLANALWWFWFRRGYWREAESALTGLIMSGAGPDTPQHCWALLHLSTVIALQGRYAEGAPYLMDALDGARRLDHPGVLAGALTVLGQALPDFEEAISAFREAQQLLEREPGQQAQMMLALLYNLRGERLQKTGRFQEAGRAYQRSLALYRNRGNVDLIAYPLGNLGRLAVQKGQLAEAEGLIVEAITLSRAIGNRQGLADWLIPLARLHLYRGEARAAETLLQEAYSLHREMNNRQGQAESLAVLALTALEMGDHAAALAQIVGSLEAYEAIYEQARQADAFLSRTGDTISPDFADCLAVTGLIVTTLSDYESAAVLFASAAQLRQRLAHVPDPPLERRVTSALSTARTGLGPVPYKQIEALAPATTPGEVFRIAFAATRRPFEMSPQGSGHDGP